MSCVYLLHFDRPYPAGRRPQHYMGVAVDLTRRVSEHRAGNPGKGGSLTRALKASGIGFCVARVWEVPPGENVFRLERSLKSRHGHRKLCPICSGVRDNLHRIGAQLDNLLGPSPTGSVGLRSAQSPTNDQR